MSLLNENILGSIRRLIGSEDDYTHFDSDLVIHINSAISRLKQLGLEEATGFRVVDGTETWGDLMTENDDILDMIKTFIYYKVRMSFDPPSSSIAAEAINKEIDKQEWLINVWVDKSSVSTEV